MRGDASHCRNRWRGLRYCLEAYAGAGGLSKALGAQGLPVLQLLEAYPANGAYIRRLDFDQRTTRELILRDIVRGLIVFIHFGLPCKSWGHANTLNGETRALVAPQGNGSLKRELLGNVQLEYCVDIIRKLIEYGGHFTIENPATSYLFRDAPISSLRETHDLYEVVFDECQCEHSFLLQHS